MEKKERKRSKHVGTEEKIKENTDGSKLSDVTSIVMLLKLNLSS
jgi:hypothetical protein